MHAGSQNGARRMTDAGRFSVLATCRCLMVIFVIGIGLTLIGIIITTVMYDGPFANDPVFKKQFEPFKTAGPIVLSIGLFILCGGIVICIIAVKTGYQIVNDSPRNVESDQTFITQSNVMSQPFPPNNPPCCIDPHNYDSQPFTTNLQPYPEPAIYHLPEYRRLPLIVDKPYPVQQYETTQSDSNF